VIVTYGIMEVVHNWLIRNRRRLVPRRINENSLEEQKAGEAPVHHLLLHKSAAAHLRANLGLAEDALLRRLTQIFS